MHSNRRRAFTLIELLVVIGIIALLVGILIPVLGRARDNSNRTMCLNNLHQIAVAINSYANDNNGELPFGAKNNASKDEDWIWWEKSRRSQIGQHGIGRYIGIGVNNTKVLTCPADNTSFRVQVKNGDPYIFSYALNAETCSGGGQPGAVDTLLAVRDASQTILVVEEDERTIDDGFSTIWQPKVSWSGCNLLAMRHDASARKQPDNPTASNPVPNPGARGNVSFCDGHAEYVPRSFVHSKTHALPDPSGFPSEPEVMP